MDITRRDVTQQVLTVSSVYEVNHATKNLFVDFCILFVFACPICQL